MRIYFGFMVIYLYIYAQRNGRRRIHIHIYNKINFTIFNFQLFFFCFNLGESRAREKCERREWDTKKKNKNREKFHFITKLINTPRRIETKILTVCLLIPWIKSDVLYSYFSFYKCKSVQQKKWIFTVILYINTFDFILVVYYFTFSVFFIFNGVFF